MPKTLLKASDITALKPRDKPYAVPTGIPNLRVHVSPKGTKTFQLRRDGTMLTLGRCDDMPLAEARRITVTGEKPEEVVIATRTIEEWIKLYEAAKPRVVNIRARAASLRRVLRPILKRDATALTTPWLEQRIAELEAGYKPRTLKTYRTTVVMLANFILDQDGLTKFPFRKLSRIVVDRQYKRLENHDIGRLTHWCYQSNDLKLACFTMIGLHTGMRRSEILHLQRSEMRLLDRPPHICLPASRTKSGKERNIPVTATLASFLLGRLQMLPARDPFLFRDVDRRFRRMMVEARVQSAVTPHGLRHTAGSVMGSEGIPLATIRDIMGHASLDMANIYAHASREDFVKARDILNVALSKAHRRSRQTLDEAFEELDRDDP